MAFHVTAAVMPAHSASEDARERAYVAGIHVLLFIQLKTWMAPELGLARVLHYEVPQVG